jgi:hypothetical protein
MTICGPFLKACRHDWETLSLAEVAAPATCSQLAKYMTAILRTLSPASASRMSVTDDAEAAVGLTP